MKDKLSSLLRFNEESRKCKSAEEVFEAWRPLLKAVSGKKGVDEKELLSSLLFKGLIAETEWVHASVSERVEAEESESVQKPKNKLDALNDDVLSHCISFLGFGDVLKSVERVCHRLFHASRRIKRPFKCESFDKLIQRNASGLLAQNMLLPAKRFETERLDVTKLGELCSIRAEDLTVIFADALKTLRFDKYSIAVTTLTFPNLENIETTRVNSAAVKAFVLRNPTVRKWTFDAIASRSVLNASFYTDLNAMQNVSEIELYLYNCGNTEEATNSPLLHSAIANAVTSLKFTAAGDPDFIRPFLHSKLRRLALNLGPAYFIRKPFGLYSLEALDIRNLHSLAGFQCLQTNPFKLKRLRVGSISVDSFVPLLRICPFGEIVLGIKDVFEGGDQIAIANQALDDNSWDEIKPKSVLIAIKDMSVGMTKLPANDDFLELVNRLPKLMPDTQFAFSWTQPSYDTISEKSNACFIPIENICETDFADDMRFLYY